MNALGIIDGRNLRFERMLAAPPERVWEFLTDSDRLAEWFGPGEIEPKIGGKVFLRPGGPAIRGTVRECVAPNLLAFTWNVFMMGSDERIAPEALMRFQLTDQDGMTALTMDQGPVAPEMLSTTAAGWHAILDILAAHVADDIPPDFMDVYHSVVAEYEKAAN